jgi:hypothetical protein
VYDRDDMYNDAESIYDQASRTFVATLQMWVSLKHNTMSVQERCHRDEIEHGRWMDCPANERDRLAYRVKWNLALLSNIHSIILSHTPIQHPPA